MRADDRLRLSREIANNDDENRAAYMQWLLQGTGGFGGAMPVMLRQAINVWLDAEKRYMDLTGSQASQTE